MKTKIIIIFAALLSFSFLTSTLPKPARAQSGNYLRSCRGSSACTCEKTTRKTGDFVYSSLEACQEAIKTEKSEDLHQDNASDSKLFCDNKSEINTALGCIPTNLEGDGFIKSILTLGVGIGGAIALILIVYGLFLITTSGGIPDKVNAGKEVITSAIAGLIFIIFSTILMNIIGINILGLPGLQ